MSDSPQEKTISVAVPRPVDTLFTYRLRQDWIPKARVGAWVKVPFGKRTTHAYIVEPPKSREELPQELREQELKEVIEISPDEVIPKDVFELCKFARDYYQAPWGEVLGAALPAAALGLKTAKREARSWRTEGWAPPELQQFELSDEQKAAVESSRGSKVLLLEGVTGSGKTEVYLESARRTLADGKGVLILVPEIALTDQLKKRFEAGLGEEVGLWHSAMPAGRRRDLFSALLCGELRVLIGARSAVFSPIRDLGLIVVDEEHDPTYKQEERVRYHARDLAVVRGAITASTVILGSATPSLESLERAREGKYRLSRLTRRPVERSLPEIETLDLVQEPLAEGFQAPLTQKALEAIRQTLEAGEQVMVFLNRRGFSPLLVCQDCGEVQRCPSCTVSLAFHKRSRRLKCHHCGHQERVPDVCPSCSGADLIPLGAGTESLDEQLSEVLGKEAGVARLDRDQVTSVSRLERVLNEFRTGKTQVLVGTQMLVKGHDFPGVTLVVVVLADALFRWPDFRAVERAHQVLTQVAGRAGRGARPGRVLVQTYQPSHPVLQVLRGEKSAEALLDEERLCRKELGYPPFGRMARLRFEAKTSEEARSRAIEVVEALKKIPGNRDVLGPSEAWIERVQGMYRWDVLLRAQKVEDLHRALIAAKQGARKQGRGSAMVLDVDPIGLG